MEVDKRPININISTITIVKVLLIFLLLYFLSLVRDILVILFISLIFASAVDPWIDWLQKRKIPRALGILLIYLILFIVVSSTIVLIIPPIVQELTDLAARSPQFLEKIISGFKTIREYSQQHGIIEQIRQQVQDNIGSISGNLQKAAGGVFTTVSNIFGGIISFFLVLVITFYMVVEENAIKKLVWSIAPAKHQPYIMQLINRMQRKIGLWLRGQLILSLVIFGLTYLGLMILGVKYALVLALIAGLTEFVPYLGPILGAIPAVFLALIQSPMLALFVIVLYFIIQQVENNLLVPKIMQRAVGLNPIVSIIVLLIGFNLAGVVGAILSIPVATAVSVFVNDLFDSKEAKSKTGTIT